MYTGGEVSARLARAQRHMRPGLAECSFLQEEADLEAWSGPRTRCEEEVIEEAWARASKRRRWAVPQAGSQMRSVGCGVVISTISRMTWRGVRNWPFCPAVAILPSMYS